MDKAPDLAHGDRIDAREGLVQQKEGGVRSQAARDLDPPPLAPGQRQRGRAAQVGDAELGQELLQAGAALAPAEPWASMPNTGEW